MVVMVMIAKAGYRIKRSFWQERIFQLCYTQIKNRSWTAWHHIFNCLWVPNITHAWWRRQMETFSALLAHCAGNSPITGEFPSQRPVTSSLMFSLISAWTNGWVNNRNAGDLRHHRAHYDVTVMDNYISWRGMGVFPLIHSLNCGLCIHTL